MCSQQIVVAYQVVYKYTKFLSPAEMGVSSLWCRISPEHWGAVGKIQLTLKNPSGLALLWSSGICHHDLFQEAGQKVLEYN